MDTLLQDIRYAIRMIVKRPGFAVIAVLALALGIGANSAIFSVVNAVLLSPLPFQEPERLIRIWETNLARGYDDSGCSPPDFREWKSRNQAFEQMAAFFSNNVNLTNSVEPERVLGTVTSANFFSVLGVSPALGRPFLPEEEQWGQNRVVILSDGLWQRRFGGDANIIGKSIKLNGDDYTVVGVMPSGFEFRDPDVQLWTPMSYPAGHYMDTRGNHFLNVVARLKPGVTLSQAQADMNSITGQLEQEFKENAGLASRVISLREDTVGDIEPTLLVLFGAVGFVLLIACANVANLLLARSAARQKEIAIRATLGASRARVIRQLLTESIMLSLLGGALGLLLALWGVDLLVSLGPQDLPRLNEISLNNRALGFTFGLSLLTGIIFGLVPAFQASRPDLNESLKEGSRGTSAGGGSRRIRNALVVAEVALSLVLLIGAGLMIKSFLRLQNVNPGFDAKNLLTMLISLPESKYPDAKPDQRHIFFNQLLEKIRSLPGVESAGAATTLPLNPGGWGKLISVEGRPLANSMEEVPVVQYRQVTPDYFSTMAIGLVKGRFLTYGDHKESLKVALINETFARRIFPDEDPIGKRIWLGPPENLLPPLPEGFEFPRIMIVGIVRDIKQSALNRDSSPEIYAPQTQGYGLEVARGMYVAVRTNSDPRNLVAGVRSQVWSLDKDQPISRISTMEERLSESLSQHRFNMLLLGIFAAVALLLAAIGIYGVMSYTVMQRTHEIGIRMALGAQPSDVLRLVVGQGMTLAVIGVALGLVGSLAVTRVMASLLFAVSTTDAVTFTSISIMLIGVAFLATYIPARRATKVDPMIALRFE